MRTWYEIILFVERRILRTFWYIAFHCTQLRKKVTAILIFQYRDNFKKDGNPRNFTIIILKLKEYIDNKKKKEPLKNINNCGFYSIFCETV